MLFRSRHGGFQYLARRRDVVISHPGGKLQHVTVEYRFAVRDVQERLYFFRRQAAGMFRRSHNEPGENSLPERNEGPSPGLGERSQFGWNRIGECPVQRNGESDGYIESGHGKFGKEVAKKQSLKEKAQKLSEPLMRLMRMIKDDEERRYIR